MEPYRTQIPTEAAPIAGAVLLNQPEEQAEEKATLVEHLQAAIAYVQTAQAATDLGPAKREFALSITHLEDAVMRFNRGRGIILQGCIATVDLEKENV